MFFNGVMGIRAQYYVSPHYGVESERHLLSQLCVPLIRLALLSEPGVEPELIGRALELPSAKVWISETDVSGKKIIRASDLMLDEESIQNDWLVVAREVTRLGAADAEYSVRCAAINGVRAPIPDQLEVKGAWVTSPDGSEHVTEDKITRSRQIWKFGFS